MLKKILIITIQLSDGGTERFISVIANEMIKLGYEVSIVLYKKRDNEYWLDSEVEIHSLYGRDDETLNSSFFSKLKRIKQIRSYIKKINPDLCIPFLNIALTETFFALIGIKIPMIATVRNKPQKMSKKSMILSNFVYKHSAAVFLQSKFQYAFFPKSILRKSFIVPNAVKEEFIKNGKLHSYSSNIRNLVTCGRLNKQKNHLMLIDAIEIVHKKYKDVVCTIYGDGEEYNNLKNKIKEMQAENYVVMAGRTDSVETVLLEADVFILSSNYEGLPNALMEAMAIGLPCISTDCPTGPKELIGSNERGILVPVNDKLSLSNAIVELIENPNKATEFGKKAHKYIIDNYRVEQITGMLLDNCRRIFENAK